MMLSMMTGRSAEKGLHRQEYEPNSQDNLLSLTCKMLNQAVAKAQCLFIDQIKICRALLQGTVIGINYAKSPQGIEITELKIKDTTGQVVVSFYKSQDPTNDPLLVLLKGDNITKPQDLLSKWIQVIVQVRSNPTNKRKPWRFLVLSSYVLKDMNQITQHMMEVMVQHCNRIYGSM